MFCWFFPLRNSGKVLSFQIITCFQLSLHFLSWALIRQIVDVFILSSMSLNLFLIFFSYFLSATFWVISLALSSSSLILSSAVFNLICLCLCQDLGPFQLPSRDSTLSPPTLPWAQVQSQTLCWY